MRFVRCLMVLIGLMLALILLRGMNPAHAQGATGVHKTLVAPVEFSDKKLPTEPSDDWPAVDWQTHLTQVLNRAKAYYADVSGGQLILDFDVLPEPVVLGNPVSSYGQPDPNDPNLDNVGQLIRDTVDAIDADVDFSLYHTLMIVYAGDDDNHDNCVGRFRISKSLRDWCRAFVFSQNDNTIASGVYEATTSAGNVLPYPTNDYLAGQRIRINRAVAVPERYYANPNAIGVANDDVFGVYVHELGHEIGHRFPELYDIRNVGWGLGHWDPMATGYDLPRGKREGASERRGVNPSEPSAWTKIQLGWVQPTELGNNLPTAPMTYSLPPVEQSNLTIYQVFLDGIDKKEYFLIENRQPGFVPSNRTNYDQRLPGAGLLIYHVDERIAAEHENFGVSLLTRWDESTLESPKGPPEQGSPDQLKFIELEAADGHADLDQAHLLNQGDKGDPYDGDPSTERFSPARSTKNCLGCPGDFTGIAITDIAQNADDSVSFDLDVGFRVEEVTLTNNTTVQVTFNKPVQRASVAIYNFNLVESWENGFLAFRPSQVMGYQDNDRTVIISFAGNLTIRRNHIYRLDINDVQDMSDNALVKNPTQIENPFGTTVQGYIFRDTTWTKDNSPYYIVEDLIVDKSATLTIEPGTVVLFKLTPGISTDLPTGQNDITVWGCLVVRGTPTDPVIFTSSAEFPARSDWGSIQLIESPSERPHSIITEKRTCQNQIAYADISYGTEAVVGSPASFSLTHSNLHDNATALALFDNPDLADVGDQRGDVDFSRSVPTVYNNNFQNNFSDILVGSQRPVIGERPVTGAVNGGPGASIAVWHNWFMTMTIRTDGSLGASAESTPPLPAPVDQGFGAMDMTLDDAPVLIVRPGSTIDIRATGTDVDSSQPNAYALTAVSPSVAALVAMQETANSSGVYNGALTVGSLTATPFGTIGSEGGEWIVLTAGRRSDDPTQPRTTRLGVCRDEDIDCDCSVRVDDIQAVASRLGQPAAAPFDVNKDGVQNLLDVTQVAMQWRDVCQMPASSIFTLQAQP